MEIGNFKKSLYKSTNLSVIFQLTDKCVLSCKYCFARGAHLGDSPAISDKILSNVISQAFETRHPNVTFEWTGGEALLLKMDFYRKILELQKKYATKPYVNCVQTSGYLFDKELIDFLIDNGFRISLTIDGTKEIHNANRPAQNGNETFGQVMATRDYIASRVGGCGFISTITKNNIGHEKEMLNLYRSLNVYSFHSNPYIYFDKNIVKDKSLALDNKDYARYFIAQFNAWYESGQILPIPHTIDYLIMGLSSKLSAHRTLCSFGGRCLTNFIAITPNGDCYNCPKFTGHPNTMLGNIKNMTISEILDADRNPNMKRMEEQRVQALNKCEDSNCRFAFLCNGGCPYLSYIASGGENIAEKDCMCEGKTLVMEYLESVKDTLVESVVHPLN